MNDLKNETQNRPKRRVLQRDPKQAVNALIRMTKALIDLGKREAQVLRKNDMHAFANLQNEKMILSQRYVQMSQEFRARVDDFRDRNDLDLDSLEKLQLTLQDQTQDNNTLLERAQAHVHSRTSCTLLSAQEIAHDDNDMEDTHLSKNHNTHIDSYRGA